jgi:outer membrane protein TolC
VRTVVLLLAAVVYCAAGPALEAQSPPRSDTVSTDTVSLTLSGALARAMEQSEEIRLARARVELAESQIRSTRAQALPQISGALSYTRTIQSPYNTGGGFQLPDSLRFEPDPSGTLEQRVSYLEQNADNAGLGGLGSLFGNLPFGQRNTYVAAITATQMLYSGGRVGAALDIANTYHDQAQLGYQEQLAELELQVRTAYYNAVLAGELETIAQAAVDQAQRFLDQERLRFKAGLSSELDVLRADVSLENLRPQLVEARNRSELAILEMKRLVNVPVSQPMRLTTGLEAPSPADSLPAGADIDQLLEHRAAVAVAQRQVSINERQLSIAKGAYLPSVDLRINYGRDLYPSGVFDWSGAQWRPDFSATIGVSVPIFSGFKRSADVQVAHVQLQQSRLELAQLRESVQLEYERARGERERAHSSIAARQRTVDQAKRVYDLTVLRYQKGLATQLEASDARLALLQARTNLAQAIADYHIADAQMMKALGRSSASSR